MKIQRLVILNKPQDKALSGVLSLGDIANKRVELGITKEIAECCRNYH